MGTDEQDVGVPSAPTVKLEVETALTHSYRVASAVNAGGTIEAVRNAAGDVELFTLGTDSTIWNFYPDPTSASGYRGVSTGIHATTFDVGRDAQGAVTLFFADGKSLSYVTEAPKQSARWPKAKPIGYSAPPDTVRIARVLVRRIDNRLYVAALAEYVAVPKHLYELRYAIWDAPQSTLRSTRMRVDSVNCVWAGSSAETAAFVCVDGVVLPYSISENALEPAFAMDEAFTTKAAAAATDANGDTHMFAVLADAFAYRLVDKDGGSKYQWEKLADSPHCTSVAAQADAKGAVHALAVGADNSLRHWQPSGQGFLHQATIATGVATMSLEAGGAEGISVFTIGTSHGSLVHHAQEAESLNWTSQAVEVPTTGKAERYLSYASQVEIYDLQGAPLANAPVTVTASEATTATVNGHVYFAAASHPIHTTTNAVGRVSIARETGSLAIPELVVDVTGHMTAGQRVTIDQTAVAAARIQHTTGAELMKAVDAAGAPLLPKAYRTQANANAIASSLQRCMALATKPRSHVQAVAGAQLSNLGVGLTSEEHLPGLRGLGDPSGAQQAWRLAFEGDSVSFESLTPARASALMAERRAEVQAAGGFLDLLEDIGDFAKSVAEDVVDVTEAVINGTKAVITCVIDGATYAYNAVIETIDAALDVAESILAKVKVTFKRIFEWIGFLVDWDDILRTRDAVLHVIDVGLSLLTASAVHDKLADGLDRVRARVDSTFDSTIASLGAKTKLADVRANAGSGANEVARASANNPFALGLLDNAATAQMTTSLADGGSADAALKALTDLGDTVATSSAYAALKPLVEGPANPQALLNELLAKLLQAVKLVFDAVVAGAKLVLDVVFGALQALVSAIRSLLAARWNIPFVSDLYRTVTNGSELTMLDLIALILAVPTTVLYKARFDEAPFQAAADVAAFKSAFTAQSVLHTPKAATHDATVAATVPVHQLHLQEYLLITGATAYITFGIFSGFADMVQPTTAIDDGPLHVIGWIIFTSELVAFCALLPPEPKQLCGAESRAYYLWLALAVGIFIDVAFLAKSKRTAKYVSDQGVKVRLVYGVFHTMAAVVACPGQTKRTNAANLLGCLPELAAPLRLTRVITRTKGASLPVLAATDVTCYAAIALITFFGVMGP